LPKENLVVGCRYRETKTMKLSAHDSCFKRSYPFRRRKSLLGKNIYCGGSLAGTSLTRASLIAENLRELVVRQDYLHTHTIGVCTDGTAL